MARSASTWSSSDLISSPGCWAWPLEGQTRFEVFSWFMGGPIRKWLNSSYNGVLHLFLKRGMAQGLTQREYAGYFHPFVEGDRKPVTLFPQELIAATPFVTEVEKGMDRLADHRALFVWGAQDFAFQETERLRLEAYFPHRQRNYWPAPVILSRTMPQPR